MLSERRGPCRGTIRAKGLDSDALGSDSESLGATRTPLGATRTPLGATRTHLVATRTPLVARISPDSRACVAAYHSPSDTDYLVWPVSQRRPGVGTAYPCTAPPDHVRRLLPAPGPTPDTPHHPTSAPHQLILYGPGPTRPFFGPLARPLSDTKHSEAAAEIYQGQRGAEGPGRVDWAPAP